MHFIFFILTGWFIQYSESDEKVTPFTINATVWDQTSDADRMQCDDSDTDCETYEDHLCKKLTNIASLNMIPETSACKATKLDTWENGTTKWTFVLHLLTNFNDGPGVDLNACPTFGQLFTTASNIQFSYSEDTDFSLKIDDYSPKPQAEKGAITSPTIEYQVTAHLEIDTESTSEGLVGAPTTKEEVETLLKEMDLNSGIGDLLVPDTQANMSNVNVNMGDVINVSFTLTFLKDYLKSISIHTYCDIDSILRLCLMDKFQLDGYIPKSVKVERLSTTILPTTTNPNLESTLGY